MSLGCRDDGGCRLGGDRLCTLEAEEFAFGVLCFDDSIGVEGNPAAWLELELNRLVRDAASDAERQRAGQFDFVSIEIG